LSSLDADVHDYESAESYLAAREDDLICVISDVKLPGMSGFDLLKRLRASELGLPVILLGEEADVSAAVAAIRAGAIDFIEKSHLDVAIPRRVAWLIDSSEVVH
jgi:FixJ family two-component response regulator